MHTIPIPDKKLLLEKFKYEDGKLYHKKNGKQAGHLMTDGYFGITIKGRQYRLHRVIWTMLKGQIPYGVEIDHIDRNPLNNDIKNLRLATRNEQMINRKHYGKKSLAKGVEKRGKRYRAFVYLNNKRFWVGTHSTLEEAINARIKYLSTVTHPQTKDYMVE